MIWYEEYLSKTFFIYQKMFYYKLFISIYDIEWIVKYAVRITKSFVWEENVFKNKLYVLNDFWHFIFRSIDQKHLCSWFGCYWSKKRWYRGPKIDVKLVFATWFLTFTFFNDPVVFKKKICLSCFLGWLRFLLRVSKICTSKVCLWWFEFKWSNSTEKTISLLFIKIRFTLQKFDTSVRLTSIF